MVVSGRHQCNAVTQADAAGALAARGEEDLRCGGVAVLLEKVVFLRPQVVDTDAVGELGLFQRVAEQVPLGVFRPGFGELQLEEDAETHQSPLDCG
jgi:hypothetical protein